MPKCPVIPFIPAINFGHPSLPARPAPATVMSEKMLVVFLSPNPSFLAGTENRM
jgi:hypothetical protein